MSKTAPTLHSARWSTAGDLRSMGHRSRPMQMGHVAADRAGKPVIAVLNTRSSINPRPAHFRQRVEDQKSRRVRHGACPLRWLLHHEHAPPHSRPAASCIRPVRRRLPDDVLHAMSRQPMDLADPRLDADHRRLRRPA